jgi:hypothetical protein
MEPGFVPCVAVLAGAAPHLPANHCLCVCAAALQPCVPPRTLRSGEV